jgi:hypothetical protein
VRRQLFLKVPGRHAVAFAAALFLVSLSSAAQVFPVQANVNLTPPYSPYLSDYTAPGSQRLIIQLMPNDITTSDHPIKLRITIEGVGITIRTKQNFVPQPLTLYGGGSPTTLYGEDILEYFNPNNLEFAGYSKAEFIKTAKIPEGIYRFSVEVFSYNRNVQLSNKGTTMAWIILNDPPLLNLPRKDTKIKILDPTSIPFTWTPRHTGSANSAFSTEYIFRLVEIWPENRNPNDAFLTQRPLYEETTTQTQFVYGLEHPALIPGRKYAWSVQARDVEGKDLFKNNGKSEVFMFQFGDALSAPENIKQDRSNARTIDISWEPPAQGEIPKEYRVRYRKKGTANRSPWYESLTDQRWITLTELQSDTIYEIQIRSEAKPRVSEYSQLKYMHTMSDTVSSVTCGKGTEIVAPENLKPLLILRPGDVITAALFKVVVTEAEATGETFSGTGYMAVPMFNGASVKVEFKGIKLNELYQLTAGEIVTTYTKDSPIARKVDQAHKIGEEKTLQGIDSANLVMIPGEIDTVYFDTEKSEVVVIDTEGNTSRHQQPVDEKTDGPAAMQITDSVGNTYTVTPDGRVIKEGSSNSLASQNANPNLVNFKQDADQHYGFDELVYDAHADKFQKESINGVESFIAWKSVSSGGTDNVLAWSDKMENLFDDVSYKSPNGDIGKRKTENDVQLTVTSPSHEEVIEVQAHIKDPSDTTKALIIGRLNVIGYDPIVRTLVLVPVNGAPIPSDASLAKELNKIFSPAIVTWNISAEESISVGLGDDGKLDDGSSGLLSNYTQEMRDVIRAFKDKKDIEDETYYLFFVGEGETGGKTGYMPRKKQCGFIFTSQVTSQNLCKTVAHELAHGAFRLEHTFATYPSLSESSTDNLMDYNTGTRLHKYQWDLIHNPVSVWGLFEGDEDGAIKSLLTSRYVYMHNQLSTKSYASNVGVNEFTQEAVNYVDSKLYQLDTAGVKTYIYFAYIWFHQGNIDRFDQLIDNTFSHAIDSISRNLNVKDFNLLAIVNAKYDTALANGLKTVSFREQFYPMTGLSAECTSSVNDYLRSGSKKTFVNGLDAALKERADILLTELKECKLEIPFDANRVVSGDINSSASKAVTDVLTFKGIDDPSCNLCTRAALLNLKNDPVLFPAAGSYVFFTYDPVTDPVIKGEISGDGSATAIVNDFQDYQNNALKTYFTEELKFANETYEQFWRRLQDKADNGEIIIGVYKPKHVFMVVSGGMIKVVNNANHTTDWKLDEQYKQSPNIDQGDKYGFCFALKNVESVPRILECGANVKSDRAPLYANMDYKGVTNINVPDNLRWFRYIK